VVKILEVDGQGVQGEGDRREDYFLLMQGDPIWIEGILWNGKKWLP